MTNHDNIISELQKEMRKQGIDTESVTITKNGVECRAIQIIDRENGISPVVYYSETETVSEILNRIKEVVRQESPALDIHLITDPAYIIDHVYLGIQKKGTENLVKKQYLNLELFMRIYIRISDDQTGSVKVTPELLHTAGLSEEETWMAALNTTRSLFSIRNMSDLLPFPDPGESLLLVGTADRLQEGACILAFPEIFRSYCEENEEDNLIILPSSTQEVIIIPGSRLDSGMSMENLAEMVADVNAAEVDPKIQLDPVVYRYCLDTDCVEIAGTDGREVL